MSLEFLASSPLEKDSLVSFLLSVFQVKADAPFVQEGLLHWKYFAPRPDWNGSRSFVLKQQGSIVGHACVCPVTFRTAAGDVVSNHPIDWAASRSVPGAGVRLLRHLLALTGTALAVGGSEQTRQILPKIGYACRGALDLYARVVRPWPQFRTDPVRRGWKAPLRLARNTLWSLCPLPPRPEHWSASRIRAFDQSLTPVLQGRTAQACTPALRTVELLNYMLRCPGAAFSGFVLSRKGTLRGCFLLSRVGGQNRIADVWVDSDLPEDWRAAYSLATRTAAQDPETFEILAAASIPVAREALRENGFRRRASHPIFIYDPQGRLAHAPPLDLHLIDGDGAYLFDPAYPYIT